MMPKKFCPETEPLLILVWVCLVGHLLCPFYHEVSILNLALTSSGRWSIRLRRVQNNAARLVVKKRRWDHVTSLLKELHWLPVKFRCQYKITTLAYRYFEGNLPPLSFFVSPHLTNCLANSDLQKQTKKQTNKQTKKLLKISNRAFRKRSFSFMAPTV